MAGPVLTIDDGSLDGPLTIQLSLPYTSRFTDGTPAVVYIHGGWRTDNVPLDPEGVVLGTEHGFATVYLNLPGGENAHSSPGMDDRRGPQARAAVALALRYAAGELKDSQACTLEQRVPDGLSNTRAIAGMSNGGNLAWATVGDQDLDIPTVHGIVSFETPSSSQFILVEPGRDPQARPFFDAESCSLDTHSQIGCEHGYGDLLFNANGEPETGGALLIDVDQSGDSSNADIRLDVAWSPYLETWVQATPAREAAERQGLMLTNRADVEDSRSFWQQREAPPNMASAIERFPSLVSIVTGTQTDHILGGLEHPVHLTGMVAAMQHNHIAWSRLNPDVSYIEAVSNATLEFQDNPANKPLSVFDPDAVAAPDETEQVQTSDYFTAAMLEVLDRSQLNIWDENIDAVLAPSP